MHFFRNYSLPGRLFDIGDARFITWENFEIQVLPQCISSEILLEDDLILEICTSFT